MRAARFSSVAFPLTPPSPSGRGRTHWSRGDETGGAPVFAARAELFPLPEGEGKGEGKRSELRPPGIDNLENFQTIRVPADPIMIMTNQRMFLYDMGP